ncbi:MAG TPA: energy transducer TonB, partial [Acetobacteraceae bacterium]|nr:energy transducer TonB [Acetobacteraceae bacterium]
MSPELRRGAFASVALHVLLLCAVLIGLPLARPPEAPPETAVDMVFQAESGPPAQAAKPAPAPAPARTPLPT